MHIITLTNNNNNNEINVGISVIDFYANWCGPCKAIAPKFEELSNDQQYNKVKFFKANVDDLNALAAQYSIRSIPTFIILKDGAKVGEVIGADIAKIKNILSKFITDSELTFTT